MNGTSADILDAMLTKQGTPAAGTAAPPLRSRVLRRPPLSREAVDRLRARLVATGPLTRAELLACAALLTLIAAAVFGGHVVHGGFLMDDWSNAAKSRYLASCCGPGMTGHGIGWGAQFDTMLNDGPAGYHLGLPVVVPVAYFLFGIHMGLHLALAVMLGVGMSLAAYVLLRKVAMAPLHAGLICTLVLLFPWSDSTRLWAMAGFNHLAAILAILGILVALRGLRASGWRALALHAGALVLYVLGTLMYELAGGLVAVAAIFYFSRGSWRQVAVRWVPDLIVAYLSLNYAKTNTLPRAVLSFNESVSHARFIGDQALTLLTRTALPFGAPPRNLLLLLIAAAIVAAFVTWWRLPKQDALRAELRWWATVAVAGAVVTVGGYVTIVPSPYGSPMDAPGIENRINMISAFGLVAIVYAVAMAVGLIAVRRLGRPPRLAIAAPLVLSLVMVIGYLGMLRDHTRQYDESFRRGQDVLFSISHVFNGAPPPGSTIYAFNFASFTAPGVPVFAWIWDMPGALKVTFQDPSLSGFPILPYTTIECGKKSMFPNGPFGTGPGETAAYGNAFFIDIDGESGVRVDSQAKCEAQRDAYQAGPLKQGTNCHLTGGGPATRLSWQCPTRPPT
jgi:hypothetical protein